MTPLRLLLLIAYCFAPCDCFGQDTPVVKQSGRNTFLSITESVRAVPGHVSQGDIANGRWTLANLQEAGRRLFIARFTRDDGFGRPGATGNPFPRRRRAAIDTGFSRATGLDANSCASCHNSPTIGGAGDFAANVLVGLGERDPPIASLEREFSNERGSPELHGTAVIELLAREMTRDLQRLRDQALESAKQNGRSVRQELSTKGVAFGALTAEPDGELLCDELEGVDRDLIIRPFGQKGMFVSVREFTINAANLHHGMQAEERYGCKATGSDDFDEDGVTVELTEGDITALTLFQAMLSVPGQVLPSDLAKREQVVLGERLFAEVSCNECHRMELPLESPVFTEPGPYNFEGTLSSKLNDNVTSLDLTRDIELPMLTRDEDGSIRVRAFTDLKRHLIADPETDHFQNETLVQRFLPTGAFITRRLWATGNTAPYGHRGDLPCIEDAILHHGGEAAASRRKYQALEPMQRSAIVEFLRSLQILPPGTKSRVIIAELPESLPYASK